MVAIYFAEFSAFKGSNKNEVKQLKRQKINII